MKFKIKNTQIYVSFLFIVIVCYSALYDKNYTVLISFLSAVFHELAHVVTALALKIKIKKLSFLPFGIKLELKENLETTAQNKKLAIIASGPALNLSLFALFYFAKLKTAALVNLCIGIFNLLPIGTLDGGKIFSLLLKKLFGDKKIIFVLEDIVSLLLSVLLCFFGFFAALKTGYNVSVLVTSLYLILLVIVRQKS